MRDPSRPTLESVQTPGADRSLTATVRSSGNLLGYEIATYAVEARPDANGISIFPLNADWHVGDAVERHTEPATNYFLFSEDVAFYRVFETQQTEYTALVIAAGTGAELERRTQVLEAGAASCEKLNNETCIASPNKARSKD